MTDSLRLGLVRPDHASDDDLIAEIEARVVVAELSRRLDDVSFDLRAHGDGIGPWTSRQTAAWPAEIDDEIDLSQLWADDAPPLSTLFARTLEPEAIEVRRRMLAHLDQLGNDGDFDDDAYAALRVGQVRPTDLWIIADAAGSVTTSDASVRALADSSGSARLDAMFDQLVEGVGNGATTDTVAKLRAERRALADQLAAAEHDARRTEVEAARRLDELEGACRVLNERLTRMELDAAPATQDA